MIGEDNMLHRQRVLVNMAFNLGMTGLLGFKTTLLAMEQGRYEDAARMLRSRWAGQVGVRAERLSEMMRTGHTQEPAELNSFIRR